MQNSKSSNKKPTLHSQTVATVIISVKYKINETKYTSSFYLLGYIMHYAGTSECHCSFMLTLRVSITDKAGMDTLPRFGAVEVARVCASFLVLQYTGLFYFCIL